MSSVASKSRAVHARKRYLGSCAEASASRRNLPNLVSWFKSCAGPQGNRPAPPREDCSPQLPSLHKTSYAAKPPTSSTALFGKSEGSFSCGRRQAATVESPFLGCTQGHARGRSFPSAKTAANWQNWFRKISWMIGSMHVLQFFSFFTASNSNASGV